MATVRNSEIISLTFHTLLIRCLTTLSVTRLSSGDYKMINESGAVGGMRSCRGNGSTRRKPAPVPLCPPQIPPTKSVLKKQLLKTYNNNNNNRYVFKQKCYESF
jgi:hypothetical protein